MRKSYTCFLRRNWYYLGVKWLKYHSFINHWFRTRVDLNPIAKISFRRFLRDPCPISGGNFGKNRPKFHVGTGMYGPEIVLNSAEFGRYVLLA